MKIHFENVMFNSRSGPNSFANRLAAELTSNGHKVVTSYKLSDISCIFIQNNTEIPEKHPQCQRLDGIWFKPEQFETHNRQIKKKYLEVHNIIWQSSFDKNMTIHHWGPRPGRVIGNGISINEVSISDNEIQKLRQKYDKIFIASANWHPQKRLAENINAFEIIRATIDQSCALVVMGSHPDKIVNDEDILYTGNIPHSLCLEMFAIADWMIHLAWLDHCPNTVIEALSQNCPIICTDSGGTSEIVKKNGIIIPESRPYNFELTDYNKPYSLNLESLRSIDWNKEVIMENAYLDISTVAKKYEEVFISTLERAS
jgi:glycosyltransferase involved in cell wall biosynthesis